MGLFPAIPGHFAVATLSFLFLIARAEGKKPDADLYFGALQSTAANAEQGKKAGWNAAIISLAWSRMEPRPGEIDEGYVREISAQAKVFRDLGYKLQLDLGMQYPPKWVFESPGAHYRNQFGDDFSTDEPGANIPNFVYSAAVRQHLGAYIQAVFSRLGSGWDWVRLGGGKFGEVNFPLSRFRGKTNCYWAFDDIAQGKAPGLADGIPPCPVPGWIPGTRSATHEEAEKFLDWYLGALQNYHDWQIREVRKWYRGDICMLYGSWGIRPGYIADAISADLDGSTPPERHGEISAGYDWARMVAGIRDPRVIVYCTWMEAPENICDDAGGDPRRWSPLHWQSSLARENRLGLRVWGENSGGDTVPDMRVTFERIRRYGAMGVMWAFENELFADPNPKHFATFQDFAEMIAKSR